MGKPVELPVYNDIEKCFIKSITIFLNQRSEEKELTQKEILGQAVDLFIPTTTIRSYCIVEFDLLDVNGDIVPVPHDPEIVEIDKSDKPKEEKELLSLIDLIEIVYTIKNKWSGEKAITK